MYIILREGNYINNVLGIFYDETVAITAANQAAEKEGDDYHHIRVFKIPTNELVNVGPDWYENNLPLIYTTKGANDENEL